MHTIHQKSLEGTISIEKNNLKNLNTSAHKKYLILNHI